MKLQQKHLILSKREKDNRKDLSSPRWAYETIGQRSVCDAGEAFEKELNEWIVNENVEWGFNYKRGLDDRYEDSKVADVIFSEQFTPKNIENWDTGIRTKIRKTIGKDEFEKKK